MQLCDNSGFIRGEGAVGFLTKEHTMPNLSYSAILNIRDYRSCEKERIGKYFREE